MSSAGIEGMVLDKYKIIKKVGAGAMGAVFRAQDTYTSEVVALKILAPKLAKDESYLKRFKREVRAARELNHENIVRVFDAGEYKGFHYFTMEFVDGKSVEDILEEKSRIPLKASLKIVLEVARALNHASSLNIVHRDIKPANIIVDKKVGVKLADMGLAKKVGEQGYTAITMAGKIMGTPFYLAPERISEEGDKIDTRADIYSLGATLYHMIFGKVPFPGEKKNPFKVYHQIMYEEVQFPEKYSLPEPVKRLIRKMMAKSPDQRYRSPQDLIRDLESTLQALSGRKRTSSAPAPGAAVKKIASSTPSSRKKKRQQPQKTSSPSSGGGSRGMMIVLLVLILLLAGAGAAIFFADQLGIPFLIEVKKLILSIL